MIVSIKIKSAFTNYENKIHIALCFLLLYVVDNLNILPADTSLMKRRTENVCFLIKTVDYKNYGYTIAKLFTV